MARIIPIQCAKVLHEITRDATDADLDIVIKQFIVFLRKHQMTAKVPYIIEEYKRYAMEQDGVMALNITTARPASKKLISAIQTAFGEKTVVTMREDASLIGGVVVRQKNTIFDASIRTQIQRLMQEMMS